MCIVRKEIEKYILRKISTDDIDILPKTMDSFGLSETDAVKYVDDILHRGIIAVSAEKKCGYELVESKYSMNILLQDAPVSEDRIFTEAVSSHLDYCNKNASKIWSYACSEMLNNAIEHSRGTSISVDVYVNALYTKVIVIDNGVGTFRTLLEYMVKNGWNRPQPEDALVELYKGKFTSDSSAHSGEGIFFSSKMMDSFMLWSDYRMLLSGNGKERRLIQSHLLAYTSRLNEIGTMVCMILENNTSRKIEEVFGMYTDLETGFIRTHIPIKETCITGDPVARSQARRICNRLHEFEEVLLDFADIDYMGQGFADEIFRVYANAHPDVVLRPIHMVPLVEKMVRHVGRGALPKNVILGQ